MPERELIILDPRLSPIQRRCVLAHEISHARHRDVGCKCDTFCERRADVEASVMLIEPLEYACVEQVYEGNVWAIAAELGVMPWVVDAFREWLRDHCDSLIFQ